MCVGMLCMYVGMVCAMNGIEMFKMLCPRVPLTLAMPLYTFRKCGEQ